MEGTESTEATIIWSVALVVICLVIILITIGVVYAVYRSRYGAFCCISLKLNYKLPDNDRDMELGHFEQHLPPTYATACSLTTEFPPDYCDALQDVVLSSGQCDGSRQCEYTTVLAQVPELQKEEGITEHQSVSEAGHESVTYCNLDEHSPLVATHDNDQRLSTIP